MGQGASEELEASLVRWAPSTRERFIGLRNGGNTCFANAVLQVLFRCEPLRSHAMQWHACVREREAQSEGEGGFWSWWRGERGDGSLMESLGELMWRMQSCEERTGTRDAYSLVRLTRQKNALFESPGQQQDAHEFYSFLVNDIGETVQALQKKLNGSAPELFANEPFRRLVCKTFPETIGKTFVHANFEGTCTSETTCKTCLTKSLRTEAFFDVSLEISDCSSVAHCLKGYSKLEAFEGFHCESEHCTKLGGKQPAERRMVLTRLPKVLVLHLKRFQFHVGQQRFVKLLHRVSFSHELKVWDSGEPDVLYKLKGFVAHLGSSAGSGHYVCVVEVEGNWFLFNDDEVKLVKAASVQRFFEGQLCAYLLFYERSS